MTRLFPLAALLAVAACQPADVAPAPADGTQAAPATSGAAVVPVSADAPLVTVYKSPTCGCCAMWVEHLEREGFRVESRDRADMAAVKDSLGLPPDLSSCHTGVVDGYVVEGHVPAQYVRQLLDERPDALGIAVPGMPIGSPGMEVGDRRDAYDVLIVDESGEAAVYASVPGSEG